MGRTALALRSFLALKRTGWNSPVLAGMAHSRLLAHSSAIIVQSTITVPMRRAARLPCEKVPS